VHGLRVQMLQWTTLYLGHFDQSSFLSLLILPASQRNNK
jgi:hypothetical protein